MCSERLGKLLQRGFFAQALFSPKEKCYWRISDRCQLRNLESLPSGSVHAKNALSPLGFCAKQW
jgi:hypothetical protein